MLDFLNEKNLIIIEDNLCFKDEKELIIKNISDKVALLNDVEKKEYDELVLNPFNLISLKKICKNIYFYLSKPEYFIQKYLYQEIYIKENDWVMEKSSKNSINKKNDRYDLTLEKDNKFHIIIENKNFDSTSDSSYDRKFKEAKNQVEDYIKEAYNNNKLGKNILYSTYIYDANYLFNNPHLINNIPYYIENNTSFFKTENYYIQDLDTNIYSEGINNVKKINGNGILAGINPIEVNKFKTTKEINMILNINDIVKLPTYTNPRDIVDNEILTLVQNIIHDIKYMYENNFEYLSTSFTTEKQILVKDKIFSNNNFYFGVGLSLDNGQHSVNAYKIVYDLLFENSLYNNNKNKILNNAIELAKNLIDKHKIKDNIFLKAKLTFAFSKEHTNKIKYANNKTTKALMYNDDILNLKKLFIELNHNNIGLIQSDIPKIKKINTEKYISPDNFIKFFKILNPKSSCTLFHIFRQKDMNKELHSFKNNFLKNINLININQLQKDYEKLNKELLSINKDINNTDSNNTPYIYEMIRNKKQELIAEMDKIDKELYIQNNFDFEINYKSVEDFSNQLFKYKDIFKEYLKDKNDIIINNNDLSYLILHIGLMHETFSIDKNYDWDLLNTKVTNIVNAVKLLKNKPNYSANILFNSNIKYGSSKGIQKHFITNIILNDNIKINDYEMEVFKFFDSIIEKKNKDKS